MSGSGVVVPVDLTGRTVGGKFCLRRCVGYGSSGAVYEADQIALGRTVAVKVLREELTRDQRLAERFHAEALLTSRLNHPNTVSVIDYGSTPDGLLFMVMEFLRGRTLTQVLRAATAPLPIERVIDYALQILDGLDEAHAAGVVHADLKADNVMVEQRRGSERIKVVDFGIAQLVGAIASAGPDSTGNQTICGTPEYMAPELISGHEPSFASDLYALGILLFELITGETPFVGGTVVEVLTRQLRDAPPRVDRSRPGVPGAVAQAIDKALAKRPGDRFASAREFRRALVSDAHVVKAPDLLLCDGCGVMISSHFRFCPECGHASVSALGSGPVSAPGSRSSTAAAPDLARTGSAGPSAPASEFEEAQKTETGSPDAGSSNALFPLPPVGRGGEGEALFQFFTGSSEETFMQLVGRTGLSKSRFIVSAAKRAADVGGAVFMAEPDPSGLRATLYPIRSMLATILDLDDIGADAIGIAAEALGLSERDVPGLVDLFGLDGDLMELEGPVRRREVLASAVRALTQAGQKRRAVLVFQDVERFDHPSQELLRHLANRSDLGDLVRVLVSNDDSYAASWSNRVVRIDLGDLDDEAIEELELHLLAHGSREMPRGGELAERCHRQPEHIEHLVRYVLEGGVASAAPAALVDLIAERIELLPYESQLLIQVAAVFGVEVRRSLLEVAAAEHFDGGQLADALAVLIARGFVTVDGDIVRFHQALEREVVYDATPADVRRALHDLAFTAMQGGCVAELILGHHADLAGQRDVAAELLDAAADAAFYHHDEVGAGNLHRRALDAARTVLLSDPSPASEERYVRISIKLADTLRMAGETTLARGVLAEARRYAQEKPALHAAIDRAEASLLAVDGWLEVAEEHLRHGLKIAIETWQMQLMSELYLDLAALLVRGGKAGQAVQELTEGIDVLTWGEGAGGSEGPATLWRLVFRLAKLHFQLGDPRAAATLGTAALERAGANASAVGVARVRGFLAQVCAELGDVDGERVHREGALASLRQLGDRRGTAELLLASVGVTQDVGSPGLELAREAERLRSEISVGDALVPPVHDAALRLADE